MKYFNMASAMLLLSSLLIAGCGGGAGTETDSGQQQVSTATIVFSVTSTARLPIRVDNILITANLPSEVTCTANPAPKANAWNLSASANYSVTPKQITFAVQKDGSQSQAISQMGEFARLTCSVTAGASLTESSFAGINNPFPAFDAVGFDTNGSSVRISSTDPLRNPYYPIRVTPSISVQFQ